MATTRNTSTEERTHALARSLLKGHLEGLTATEQNPGTHPAPSEWRWFSVPSSNPANMPYLVRASATKRGGCGCEGFAAHGYCKHYALALEVLGCVALPLCDECRAVDAAYIVGKRVICPECMDGE